MGSPECIYCDDTGVMYDRVANTPALCTHCDRGQSENARRQYTAIMKARQINLTREKINAARVQPSVVVKPNCMKCGDSGWRYGDYPVGDPRRYQVVPCECKKEQREKARQDSLMRLCRLPEARTEWTLDKYQSRPGVEKMLGAAKKVVNGSLLWAVFISPSGYGKTHLAVAICREYLKQGKSARYIYAPDLMNELRQGIDDEGQNSYHARMNFFKNVRLLALDDLGTENTTPWVREQLDTIIDHRYVNKMPLVITTNKSLDGLMERVASRIKRTIVEGFGEVVIPTGVSWDEYRVKTGTGRGR